MDSRQTTNFVPRACACLKYLYHSQMPQRATNNLKHRFNKSTRVYNTSRTCLSVRHRPWQVQRISRQKSVTSSPTLDNKRRVFVLCSTRFTLLHSTRDYCSLHSLQIPQVLCGEAPVPPVESLSAANALAIDVEQLPLP